MAPQGGEKVEKFDSRHVTLGIFAGMESEEDKVADEDSDVPIKKEKNDEQDGKLDDDISQVKKKKNEEEGGQHDEVDPIEEGEKNDNDDVEFVGSSTVVDFDDDGIASVSALEPRNDEKAKQRRRANERLRDKLAFEEGRQT